ncbi:MAG: autotransporter outer membrane beta-barrel domain-containing protein [Thermoguttaceae bacterium]
MSSLLTIVLLLFASPDVQSAGESVVVCNDASSNVNENEFFDERFASFLGQRRRGSRGGGVWANAYFGKASNTRSFGDEELKVAPDILGAQIGFDKRLFGARWSLYYNYGNTFTRTTVRGEDISRWQIDNHMLGLSFVKYNAMTHFLVLGNVGYDFHRIPQLGQVHLGGEAHGIQTGIYGEIGLDIVLPNKSWAIKPFTGLHYFYQHVGDIEHSLNPPSPNIHLPNSSNQALHWITGVRCNKRFNESFEAQARVAIVEQILQNQDAIDSLPFSMVSGTLTPSQFLVLNDPGRDRFWLGAGLKWYVNYTDIRVFADYDAIFCAKSATHIGSLGLLFAW